MVKRKCIAIAILGLAISPQVWAQSLDKLPIKFNFWTAEPVLTMDMVRGRMPVSGGCSGYSFGKTAYTLLAPSDIAAQGGVTATLTAQVTNVNNALRSHKVTVTSEGTKINLVGSSANGVSAMLYFYSNGGTTPYYSTSVPLNGYLWTYTMQPSYAGESFQAVLVITDKYGNTSQDRINVPVVAGSSPNIISQDGYFSNVYLQANPNFGGGDMMHTCQICIDYPTACSGAQHTPYITGKLTNHTSGEVQTFQRQVAGSVVSENDPISGSAFWSISVLPGDQTDGDATGEIFCSAVADDIFNQNNPNNDGLGVPGIELAWFKGTIKQSTCKLYNYKGNAGVDCKYLYGTQSNGSRTFPMCTTRTWIPDFQPNDVFIPAALVPGYPDLALVPPFYFALSAGLRWPNLPGYPWQFPFYYLDQVTPVLPTALAQATDLLNWTFISQNSKIRDCTSADNGYQVLIYFPGID